MSRDLLPDAIIWRYGHVADTAGGQITAWRSDEPQPDEAEIDALIADYLAAPKPRLLPRLVIADRLTDDEVALVAGLQSGTPEQQRWWLRWVSASEIDATDPANVAAFQAVFGEERAAELLAMED